MHIADVRFNAEVNTWLMVKHMHTHKHKTRSCDIVWFIVSMLNYTNKRACKLLRTLIATLKQQTNERACNVLRIISSTLT